MRQGKRANPRLKNAGRFRNQQHIAYERKYERGYDPPCVVRTSAGTKGSEHKRERCNGLCEPSSDLPVQVLRNKQREYAEGA